MVEFSFTMDTKCCPSKKTVRVFNLRLSWSYRKEKLKTLPEWRHIEQLSHQTGDSGPFKKNPPRFFFILFLSLTKDLCFHVIKHEKNTFQKKKKSLNSQASWVFCIFLLKHISPEQILRSSSCFILLIFQTRASSNKVSQLLLHAIHTGTSKIH